MRLRGCDVLTCIPGLSFGAVGGFCALGALVGGAGFGFFGAEVEFGS